jgi:hypothetical protein
LRHVLVSATADAEQHDVVSRPTGALPLHPCDRVCGLERRDDSFESTEELKSMHRFIVANRHVRGATAVLEE